MARLSAALHPDCIKVHISPEAKLSANPYRNPYRHIDRVSLICGAGLLPR